MKNKTYQQLKNCFEDDSSSVCRIKTQNVKKTTVAIYEYFYDSAEWLFCYKNVVFDCAAWQKSGVFYSDYLATYKKCNFDEVKEAASLRQSKEKAFRCLLNEYIANFKKKPITKRKNLYLDITPQGQFVAIKNSGDKFARCELTESERMLFYLACFIKVNEFNRYVKAVKDLNYRAKPIVLANFPDSATESFDYAAFLKRQKSSGKIIIVTEDNAPKTPR